MAALRARLVVRQHLALRHRWAEQARLVRRRRGPGKRVMQAQVLRRYPCSRLARSCVICLWFDSEQAIERIETSTAISRSIFKSATERPSSRSPTEFTPSLGLQLRHSSCAAFALRRSASSHLQLHLHHQGQQPPATLPVGLHMCQFDSGDMAGTGLMRLAVRLCGVGIPASSRSTA